MDLIAKTSDLGRGCSGTKMVIFIKVCSKMILDMDMVPASFTLVLSSEVSSEKIFLKGKEFSTLAKTRSWRPDSTKEKFQMVASR